MKTDTAENGRLLRKGEANMKTWRLVSITGVLTMVALMTLFRHGLLELAIVLTAAYVVSSIWILIRANRKAADRKAVIEKNREVVFQQWLDTADMNMRRQ